MTFIQMNECHVIFLIIFGIDCSLGDSLPATSSFQKQTINKFEWVEEYDGDQLETSAPHVSSEFDLSSQNNEMNEESKLMNEKGSVNKNLTETCFCLNDFKENNEINNNAGVNVVNELNTEQLRINNTNKKLNILVLDENKNILHNFSLNFTQDSKVLIVPETTDRSLKYKSLGKILGAPEVINDSAKYGVKWDVLTDNSLNEESVSSNHNFKNGSNDLYTDISFFKTLVNKFENEEKNIKKLLVNLTSPKISSSTFSSVKCEENKPGSVSNSKSFYRLDLENLISSGNKVSNLFNPDSKQFSSMRTQIKVIAGNNSLEDFVFPSLNLLQMPSSNMQTHLKPIILEVIEDVEINGNKSNDTSKYKKVHYIPLFEIGSSLEKVSSESEFPVGDSSYSMLTANDNNTYKENKSTSLNIIFENNTNFPPAVNLISLPIVTPLANQSEFMSARAYMKATATCAYNTGFYNIIRDVSDSDTNSSTNPSELTNYSSFKKTTYIIENKSSGNNVSGGHVIWSASPTTAIMSNSSAMVATNTTTLKNIGIEFYKCEESNINVTTPEIQLILNNSNLSQENNLKIGNSERLVSRNFTQQYYTTLLNTEGIFKETSDIVLNKNTVNKNNKSLNDKIIQSVNKISGSSVKNECLSNVTVANYEFGEREVCNEETSHQLAFHRLGTTHRREIKNYLKNKFNFSDKIYTYSYVTNDNNLRRTEKIARKVRKIRKFIPSLHTKDNIDKDGENENFFENLLSNDEIESLVGGLNENLVENEDHAKYFPVQNSSPCKSHLNKKNLNKSLDLGYADYDDGNLPISKITGKSYIYYDDIDPEPASLKIQSLRSLKKNKNIQIMPNNNKNCISFNSGGFKIFNHAFKNMTTLFDFLVLDNNVKTTDISLKNTTVVSQNYSDNCFSSASTTNYFSSMSTNNCFFSTLTTNDLSTKRKKTIFKISISNDSSINNEKSDDLTMANLMRISDEEDNLKRQCETKGRKCVCYFDFDFIEKNVSSAASISNGSLCKSFVPIEEKIVVTNDVLPRILKFDDKSNDSDAKILDEPHFMKLLTTSGSIKAEKRRIKKGGKDVTVTEMAGNKIELPCSENETHHLPESTNAPKYVWKFGDHSPVTDNDQLHVNPSGNLVINSVTAQYDSFECTFSFINPDTGNEQNLTTMYHLNVLMLPILSLIAKIHYHTSAACNDALLEMFELFLPQLIEKDICQFNNKSSDVCYITLKNPMCSNNESQGTDIVLNYHVSLTPVKSLLVHTEEKSCNYLCLEMLSLKLFLSLIKSVSTVLSIPVETSTKAELTPDVNTLSRLFSLGCGVGFELNGIFCVPCGIGTYSKEGSARCYPCSRGEYQPKKGSGACIPCPDPFVPGCRYLVLERQNIAGTLWVINFLCFMLFLLVLCCCYKRFFTKDRQKSTKEDPK